MVRTMSLNTETGEAETLKTIWGSSSWAKLEKSKGKGLERANSFVGRSRGPSVSTPTDGGAVVIVDPFSTGAHLAAAVCAAGYKCARVFSIWDSPVAALVQHGISAEFCATIQYDDQNSDQDAATNEVVYILLHCE